MSMKTLALVMVPDTAPRHTSRISFFSLVRTRVRDALRAHLERARERRQARRTATALEHLGPRELRDIGLVRLSDVYQTRYCRIHDLL